jgi:uncharacterized protein (DUF4415 family)
MTVRIDSSELENMTNEEIKEIKSAAEMPVVYDEDSPELTEEMYEEFKKAAEKRREERKKQVLTLRVSADTLNKAKSLGKGYTGILSRLIELALNDPDMIKKCL